MQAQKSVKRWKNITVDVDGAADRFACEYPHGKFRRASGKRAAQVKRTRDEWNSGCDRVRQWQAGRDMQDLGKFLECQPDRTMPSK